MNTTGAKTLEQLEKESWPEPTFHSYLVKTCHKLRKKPLQDFEVEDLRIMIGQSIGLKYLIPLALEELKVNILAEGDFYEGDLLSSILKCDDEIWKTNSEYLRELISLIDTNMESIKESNLKISDRYNELKSLLSF